MNKVLERTQGILNRFARGLPITSAPVFGSAGFGRARLIFTTPPGATTNNLPSTGPVPVDATGTFTLDLVNQTITIDLLNLELNPQYDFQILGSVQITLSNLNGSATAPTVQTSSFTAMNVASSTPTALASQPANKWAFPTIAGGAHARSGQTSSNSAWTASAR